MTEFHLLKSCLAEWADSPAPEQRFQDRACERLRAILFEMQQGQCPPGQADLAGLVQHVVRRQRSLDGHTSVWKVPVSSPWPSLEEWQTTGLSVTPQSSGYAWLKEERNWEASWLEGSDVYPPLHASLMMQDRRRESSATLPLDPAIRDGCGFLAERFAAYRCSGQQQAIHSTMFLKPGATLAVNLPTGSGKSLVASVSALLAPPGALTVVVVPTIALAIDQERQLRGHLGEEALRKLPDQLVWHSGLDVDARTSIRERIDNGSQRVLFTSPEAVTGSLSRVLCETAKLGRLAYLVIDEAHLVAQWGTEFRPEFQAMASLRRELIQLCPSFKTRLRTLLLSATLTQESLDVLEQMYSEDILEIVSAVHLRPEPEYWFSHAASEEEQARRVLELVGVVPRPFLLYVTEVDAAISWFSRLRQLGYSRLGCVHGKSSTRDREQVIEDWRKNRIDFVVATSAFGVGMDKDDVRTVIHACAPETVDRLYQEVGRGGRDGKACLSVVVYTDQDLRTAESLATKCFISIDRGLERWHGMIDHAETIEGKDNLYRVSLDSLPADKSYQSPANRAWNLRTLLLLHRANIIYLESVAPPELKRRDGESEEDYDARRKHESEKHQSSAFLRLLNNSHRDRSTWLQFVEPLRSHSMLRDKNSYEDLRRVLSGKEEVSSVLVNTYRATINEDVIEPMNVCGGCPACRGHLHQRECRPPRCRPIQSPYAPLSPSLEALLQQTENGLLFVTFTGDLSTSVRQIKRDVLPSLVRAGISEVALPNEWLQERSCRELYSKMPGSFLIHRSANDYDEKADQLRVPRVTVIDPTDESPLSRSLLLMERPAHIVICRRDIPDLDRPERKLFDVAPSITLDRLLEALQS